MNFFGHAAVASWSASTPGTTLGAMLPDFESMTGARIASASELEVSRGIDLHHATDAVFHRLPAVTALMRELDALLLGYGCARGPRRGVAHIGVELLLDGVLVGDATYRAAYTAAIAHDAELVWRDPADAPRYVRLMERLREYGVPEDLQSPDAIAQRLQRMLAHRPLLAPSSEDMRAIRRALQEYRARVEVAAETVLRGTRAGLTS